MPQHWLQSFLDHPPRKEPGTFGIDPILGRMEEARRFVQPWRPEGWLATLGRLW